MTTIIKKYIGITHPIALEEGKWGDEELGIFHEAWRRTNCPNGIHLWDEVLSAGDDGPEHYLHCDACGIMVYIEKIVIPDDKDDVVK